MKTNVIDLIEKAIEVRERAYSKYSGFKVGAIVIGDNDKMYKGVNVENKSYGLTMCAERTAIFSGVTDGMKKLKTIVIVADTEDVVTPCGACREVISEFATPETEIVLSNLSKKYKIYTIQELLPFSFELEE
ncbi:cytidine deaminase [Haliovirga abyssi]|uniref:Cytidine deaminase n=1 Tax=Haliovirga abyssi TaxID=2996794 RepID=A0AAU9DWX9_9FUSO|nr:cytidine deaminase [Haliovirga abyssi]BDU50851.1 cytidine deaminase [Haliovirga abyssi]